MRGLRNSNQIYMTTDYKKKTESYGKQPQKILKRIHNRVQRVTITIAQALLQISFVKNPTIKSTFTDKKKNAAVLLGSVKKQDTSTIDINPKIDKITEHKINATGHKRRKSIDKYSDITSVTKTV